MIAALALGTAQLDRAYGVANRRAIGDPNAPAAILEAAADAGILWIDTAPDYGRAEAIVGAWLRDAHGRASFRVASKLPALPDALPTSALAAHVRHCIDASRERLGLDCLDAYLVHAWADLDRHGPALVDALCLARDAGVVRRIGVSVYGPVEAEAALRNRALDAIQYPYHLLDRRLRDAGATARLRDAGVLRFGRSALLQGLFALSEAELPASLGAARPWLARVTELAQAHDLSPVALALRFALHGSHADFVVLGVDSAAQLQSACELVRAPLRDGVAAAVDATLREVPADVYDPRRWRSVETVPR